jgi:hypothetical protein
VIAPPNERFKRMFVGIKPAEALDTQQGREKQRLKAAT